MVRDYLMVLEPYPAWAVGQAVMKVCRGEVPEIEAAYCPKPPELCRVVRAIMDRKAEHDRLTAPRLLPPIAPPMTEAEMARRAKVVESLLRPKPMPGSEDS